MLTQILLVVVSLAALALGADVLVRGAGSLARRAGMSPFFFGLTVVGFGTSTPELFTSLIAGLEGRGDIAIGNVVGSNIFNLALILGVTALIRPITVRLRDIRTEAWIVILAAVVPFVALPFGGVLGRASGALMLGLLALYVAVAYRTSRRAGAAANAAEPDVPPGLPSVALSLAAIAFGLAILVGGSHLLVESASAIAATFGVSELVIGLTIVSAGTSTPELFTSLVAARRRELDLAVGNVFGSNIFNVFGILGLTCLIEPQFVRPQVLALDTPVMLAASLAMLPILFTGGRISRTEGGALVAGYALYVVVQLMWAPAWFG